MFTISKEFHFSASHQLTGLPKDHQCARLHGHNYIVILTLRSETLDSIGFVRDYGELDVFADWLKTHFDHRHLNHVVKFNPTAELLAEFIYKHVHQLAEIPYLYSVTVMETPKTVATYYEREI